VKYLTIAAKLIRAKLFTFDEDQSKHVTPCDVSLPLDVAVPSYFIVSLEHRAIVGRTLRRTFHEGTRSNDFTGHLRRSQRDGSRCRKTDR
jgi:hypothetical protein